MSLRDIQSGGGGALAPLARAGLRVLSWGWAAGDALKRAAYACGLRRSRSLGLPVISVGNIAVGGTGKTPFVAWLARRLREAGRHPGILARGYGGPVPERMLNDEGLVLEHLLGTDVPQVQDPDRVKGAALLRAAHPQVDVILLDDGFQHRRARRDLDIVLLDAMEPFGFGHLLPRGRLREPPRALRRADAVVLTRTERVDAARSEEIAAELARYTAAPVARARSEPAPAELADELAGADVFAVCGIGNPDAFLGTLADLGARVVGRRLLWDHETLPASAWADVVAASRAAGAECVVTTRKDAVKYRELPSEVVVVDVETVVTHGAGALWALVERALGA